MHEELEDRGSVCMCFDPCDEYYHFGATLPPRHMFRNTCIAPVSIIRSGRA